MSKCGEIIFSEKSVVIGENAKFFLKVLSVVFESMKFVGENLFGRGVGLVLEELDLI